MGSSKKEQVAVAAVEACTDKVEKKSKKDKKDKKDKKRALEEVETAEEKTKSEEEQPAKKAKTEETEGESEKKKKKKDKKEKKAKKEAEEKEVEKEDMEVEKKEEEKEEAKEEAKEEEKEEAKEEEKKEEPEAAASNERHGVFIGGLPWSADEETVKKDFAECGEIIKFQLPMNPEGKPKGIAFVDYTNAEAVKKALEFNETEYGGRTIVVKVNTEPLRGQKGKGKGKKGEQRQPGEKPEGALSVIVKNLTYDTTEDCLREKFSECGEISRVSLLKDRETGESKGIGFVDFAETEATDKAVAKCNEDFYGRPMFVDFAGNKPAKGEGKDGKGKGKKGDGKKGKGKGKKGEGKKGKGKAPIPAGKVESFDSDSE